MGMNMTKKQAEEKALKLARMHNKVFHVVHDDFCGYNVCDDYKLVAYYDDCEPLFSAEPDGTFDAAPCR